MRIRLALTLDIRRDQAAPDGEPERETTLDALAEHAADQPHDAPRIGFRAIQEEM